LALIQMKVEYGKPELNIRRVIAKIDEAAQKRPDVLILPEMWNVGFSLKNLAATADRRGNPAAKIVGELAAQYQVNIVAGSVADLREQKVYNTSYIYDRAGAQIAAYSKIHLFGLMQEGIYLSPGNAKVDFDLDGIKFGVIICYDLRFPELSRALALDGAKLIFVPAQWPYPRILPWRTLLQARAMENQLFVAGVNCVGTAGKTEYFGHSMVINPLGEILAEGSQEEEIIYVDIDLDEVDRTRKTIDYFNDRRPDAYR
jgi:omega-amidase